MFLTHTPMTLEYLAKKATRPQYLFILCLVLALCGRVGFADLRGDVSQTCGNGVVDVGEKCDVGNRHGGGGCSPTCQIETGWACRGGVKDQMSFCHVIACGDGLLDKGELCDDANTNSNDGCSSSCKVETGWVCAGEPSKCHPIVCGDGFVDKGEQCDDGNARSGDGCDSGCGVEVNWTCSKTSPSACKSVPFTIKLKPNDGRQAKRNPYLGTLR